MSDMLERLYAAKARALLEEERREPPAALQERADRSIAARRPFRSALTAAVGPAIVAEIKRASPSQGLITRNFDAAEIAAGYERAGVDAISVLTESDHFLGDLANLELARANSRCPILRKDFLSTPYQIAQSAAYGADAVLLIVAGLDDATLALLLADAERFALEALVEVHDELELARAVAAGATTIGINNRDLRTFETDLGVTEHLLPSVPSGTIVVSESGVHDPEDTARLYALGARGFLVGEAMMRAEDPVAFVRELKTAGTRGLRDGAVARPS
jgi:indole-3-glycerol phosphate synthase